MRRVSLLLVVTLALSAFAGAHRGDGSAARSAQAALAQVIDIPPAPARFVSAAADGDSFPTGISADGRFVAFISEASNLVRGDTNGRRDAFVRDRLTGLTERVSVGSGGAQTTGTGVVATISADGQLVAFQSNASNLVSGDTNGSMDIFVHDRLARTTERVSVSNGGVQGNEYSYGGSISADGRFVAFDSNASNLTAGDTNEWRDEFVRDRLARRTERVSVSSSGAQSNGESGSYGEAISADGRFVAFTSTATNLAADDTNRSSDVFVRDRLMGTTERVSVSSRSTQANDDCYSPAISADGRFVAFHSEASNLVPGDTNRSFDVFVHDRLEGTTERISVRSGGAQANGLSGSPTMSADGRFVAFDSDASNLGFGKTDGVLLRDRRSGTTEPVSVTSGGAQANGVSNLAVISADGRFVAFFSRASNLVVGDTNNRGDAFARDLALRSTELISVGTESPLRAATLLLRPWPARAGKQLTATARITIGSMPVARARVTCVARVGGRTLRWTARTFRAGRARCVWEIPPGARGRGLNGTVSATTAEGTVSKHFAGIVR